MRKIIAVVGLARSGTSPNHGPIARARGAYRADNHVSFESSKMFSHDARWLASLEGKADRPATAAGAILRNNPRAKSNCSASSAYRRPTWRPSPNEPRTKTEVVQAEHFQTIGLSNSNLKRRLASRSWRYVVSAISWGWTLHAIGKSKQRRR